MLKIVIYVCVAYVVSAANEEHNLQSFNAAQRDLNAAITKYNHSIQKSLGEYNDKISPSLFTITLKVNAHKQLIAKYEELMETVVRSLKTEDVLEFTCSPKIETELQDASDRIFQCAESSAKEANFQNVLSLYIGEINEISSQNCSYTTVDESLNALLCIAQKEVGVVIASNKALLRMEIAYQKMYGKDSLSNTCLEKHKKAFNDQAQSSLGTCFKRRK